MYLLSLDNRRSSKSGNLEADALRELLNFYCLMKLPERRFCLWSWSHINSTEAITSDSFGRADKPCLSPNRRTLSSSDVRESPVRLDSDNIGTAGDACR